jgi:hypothetical protein
MTASARVSQLPDASDTSAHPARREEELSLVNPRPSIPLVHGGVLRHVHLDRRDHYGAPSGDRGGGGGGKTGVNVG